MSSSPQTILKPRGLYNIGFAFVMMISPLAADLTAAVIAMEKEHPDIFGKSGAYAQVYALFTCAIGAGVLAGPAWVSFAYGRVGWRFMVCTLGALSASAIAPVVSQCILRVMGAAKPNGVGALYRN